MTFPCQQFISLKISLCQKLYKAPSSFHREKSIEILVWLFFFASPVEDEPTNFRLQNIWLNTMMIKFFYLIWKAFLFQLYRINSTSPFWLFQKHLFVFETKWPFSTNSENMGRIHWLVVSSKDFYIFSTGLMDRISKPWPITLVVASQSNSRSMLILMTFPEKTKIGLSV